MEVSVVDSDGLPVPGLSAADFQVSLDGAPRRVVSAEWVPLARQPAASPAASEVRAAEPGGFSSNARATGGRLIVLAIDQPNIRPGGSRALLTAIDRFLDHLSPSDRVAAVGLGPGTAPVPFTTDRARIKTAVGLMEGQRQVQLSHHVMDLRTAASIAHGDASELDRIARRDCPNGPSQRAEACAHEIVEEATFTEDTVRHAADMSIEALLSLVGGLGSIDGSKTVVLVSEGLVLWDGDVETSSKLNELGARASATRTSLYALRLDERLVDVSNGNTSGRAFGDQGLRTQGLTMLAGAARGAIFTVTGSGDAIFDRIERELSGYYLLGVEADSRDADRKPHPLQVSVSKRGVSVRAWRAFAAPAPAGETPRASTRAAVAAALAMPVVSSELPLRAVTFNLQGREPGKVQLLIHADIGADYTAPRNMTITYLILDENGHAVETQSFSGRLAPRDDGLPSAVPFVAGASLAPGDYLLRLAAADGSKIGSVEHPIHASLGAPGGLMLSDLIIGEPLPTGLPSRPTVGDVVRHGLLQAYLECYGPAADDVTVRYEVMSGEQEQPLLGADAPPAAVGDSRVIFNGLISMHALPPGTYRLRANVSRSGAAVTTLTRPFEVAAPPAPRANIPADAVPAGKPELFLPIDARDLASPFALADAVETATLRPFAERVPAAARQSFDEGMALLKNGELAGAEQRFKRAIQPDADATAGLAYLGVVLAASGRDTAASGAWETALANGGDLPQLYDWLGAALLRMHQLQKAQSILEEAHGRWPGDTRFARPLALLYATFGRGYDALGLLERYIDDGHSDAGALFLGVQWIYQLHVDGGVLHGDVEDLAQARRYADLYASANGPKQALIRLWTSYLEKRVR